MCLKKSGLLLLLTAICLAFGQFNKTVRLDPSPSKSSVDELVCLGSMPVFVCNTTEGSLLWETNSSDANCVYDEVLMRESPKDLGDFVVHRDGVFVSNATTLATAVNSTAMLTVPVQLSHDDVTLKCYENSDLNQFSEIILNVGPPPAPTVTSITQSSTNSSSVLISWSMSDCAVQYVVTIITSSDGSVYLNITTSDTNTTVTLPTGVEYCVTVLGVDSINRTGQPSQQQCYPIAPTSTRTSSGVSTSYQSISTTTSPSVSPVVGGVNAVVIAVSIVLVVMVLMIITAVVGTVCLIIYWKAFVKRNNSIESGDKYEMKSQPPTDHSGEMDKVNETQLKDEPKQKSVWRESKTPPTCMCQVFYVRYEGRHNYWKIVFAFFPKEQLMKVKQLYQKAECGPMIDELVFQCENIEILVPSFMGWKINLAESQHSMHVKRSTIESYTGENKPPVIEFDVRAEGTYEQRGDLRFCASIKGGKSPTIIIERKYERSTSLTRQSKTSQPPKRSSVKPELPPSMKKSQPPKKPSRQPKKPSTESTQPKKPSTESGQLKKPSTEPEQTEKPSAESEQPEKPSMESAQPKKPSVEQLNYCQLPRKSSQQTSCTPPLNQEPQLADNNVTTRRGQSSSMSNEPETVLTECVCQVLYFKQGINHWVIKLAFCTRECLDKMKGFYQNANFGKCYDVQFKVQLIPITLSPHHEGDGIIATGWEVTVNRQSKQVTTAAVEQYTGEGEPPYCEMTLRADENNTHHNGNFTVTLDGTQPLKNIKIKRKNERLDVATSYPITTSVDNSDNKEYVCQVFFAQYGINTWKIICSFIPKGIDQEEVKKRYYSFEEVGPTITIQLNKNIVKVTAGKASNGWSCDPYSEEVKRTDIEAYTGVSKPPHCVMTLRAAIPDGSTPPDLTLSVTITGVKEPIILERKAKEDMFAQSNQELDSYDSTMYMCQAFYHKLEGINHWKATLAFFPKEKQMSVNTVYQSDITGPSVEFQFKRGSDASVKLGKLRKTKEWKVTINPDHNKVAKATVDTYGRSGRYTTDKPPYCEMILQAVSDSTTPPDLTISLTLDGVKMQGAITLERPAEDPPQLPPLPPPDSSTLQNQDNKAVQGSESRIEPHKEPPKDTDLSGSKTIDKLEPTPKYQDRDTSISPGAATADMKNIATAVYQTSLSAPAANSEPLPKSLSASSLQSTEQHEETAETSSMNNDQELNIVNEYFVVY